MKFKSFIPGPTQVHPDVLAKMATHPIPHRSKQASALQKGITEKTQQLLYTQGKVVLSTSSATGLMEGATRCATQKKAIVFTCGAFGDRWAEVTKANDIACEIVRIEDGQPVMPELINKYLSTGQYDVATVTHNETSTGVMNPIEVIAEVMAKYSDIIWMVDAVSSAGGVKIEVDKLGIDVLITSSQKALALPPGISLATVSKKAEKRFMDNPPKGYYFDFRTLLEFIEKKDHQYHATPSISHMFALDFQLDRILKEGLENRFTRHVEMAEYMIVWANQHFKTFAAPGFESLTLTTIENNKGINIKDLKDKLEERGLLIGSGYGKIKDKTFRIAHMGELTLDDMMEVTEAIEDILKL